MKHKLDLSLNGQTIQIHEDILKPLRGWKAENRQHKRSSAEHDMNIKEIINTLFC